jgi:reactive intermediate/imine deaminase
MTVKFMNPASMPPSAGYTHVVQAENCRTLYISGQVPTDRNGNLVGGGDLALQTEQVFKNLEAALQAGGASFADVVKLNYYVRNIAQMQVVRDVRDRHVNQEHPPASSAVEVSRLVKDGFLIEIDAIAAIAG